MGGSDCILLHANMTLGSGSRDLLSLFVGGDSNNAVTDVKYFPLTVLIEHRTLRKYLNQIEGRSYP
jgi:hypothetical protein